MRLGIDIGSDYARAARLDDTGLPHSIPVAPATSALPAVARQTLQGLQIGFAAAHALVGNAETTVQACTRLMGRAGELPAALIERLPYAVREQGGETLCNLLYAEVPISTIYGRLARALVDAAELHTGTAVESVVLTVPASAEHRFRVQARAAVEAQGIRVQRLINQPAAALLTTHLPDHAHHIAVVNCSGGTTEISIAQRSTAGTRILATAGDALLGSDDLAWSVAEQLNQRFRRLAGVDVFGVGPIAAQGLRRAAGEALETLCIAPETTLVLDHGAGFGRDLVTVVRRSDVDTWLNASLHHLQTLCHRALTNSHLAHTQIDAVVLIGSAAHLPMLQLAIAHAFQIAPGQLQTANAANAAVYGAALASASDAALVWDVTPYPLGVACFYGDTEILSPIIAANTPIPTPSIGQAGAFMQQYTTRYPDQTEVRLDVLQYRGPRQPQTWGDGRVLPNECELLGSWMFTNLKPQRGRAAAFSIAFAIDSDGILHLQAQETATRHTLTAQVLNRD